MPYKELTAFGGLPVVRYEPGEEAPPGTVAWRLESWDHSGDWKAEASPGFLDLLASFLDEVPADQVRALVIGSWGYAAFNPAPIAALAGAADRLPELRALFLGDMESEVCEISWITQGDLTPLLTAYPRLELLGLRGSGNLALTPMRHESLRELVIESGGLPATVVRAVGACDLPALDSLELWLGIEDYGGDTTIDDLATILSGERLPALRQLRLRNAEFADQIAAAIAVAPVVPRLETLDLSLGILTDVGAEALLAGQPLAHLKRLDLHYHFLSDAMCVRLRNALPGIVDVSERGQEDEDDGEVYRYTAVGE